VEEKQLKCWIVLNVMIPTDAQVNQGAPPRLNRNFNGTFHTSYETALQACKDHPAPAGTQYYIMENMVVVKSKVTVENTVVPLP
jgi:hypothetical protein